MVEKGSLNCVIHFMDDDRSSNEEIVKIITNDDDHLDLVNISTELSNTCKRQCIRNYCEEIVSSYSENEFTKHFRINRELFNNLCCRFEEHEIYKGLREDKRISASKHLFIFLWFAGHEACSYSDIADCFDVSQWTVTEAITRVIEFLNTLADETILWPTTVQMEETAKHFEEKYGFPKVIGAIDGTHVIIDPPPINKDDYIDRKGNVSICVQALCNEHKKFIDVFIGFPGFVHDSRVLHIRGFSIYVDEELANTVQGQWSSHCSSEEL